MAAILRELGKSCSYLFNEVPNPQSRDWPLIGNPVPVLAILAGYLYFVLKAGPAWMEKRQPFKLDRLLQIYNLGQVLFSFIVMWGLFWNGIGTTYSWVCEPLDFSDNPSALQMTRYMYIYFLVKVIDLLDTVFFILRKKQNQVSFLHVYHHTGMVALSWGATTWASNGHGSMLPFLNSIVHMVMYFYYYLTSVSKDRQKFVWCKKYITQLQILQFFILLGHFGKLIIANPCGYPKLILNIVFPQNCFMLFLFVDFYVRTYIKKKEKMK